MCSSDLPIVDGLADIVIADRQTATVAHFSPLKRRVQRIGSAVVSRAAETRLPDAASGFRAYSAHSLIHLNIITQFSYTMETIIQAGNKRLRIASLSIATNPKTRESRLFRSPWQHVRRSAYAIMRSYIMFKPHVFFGVIGALMFGAAALPIVRFLTFFARGEGDGHVQSLILGSALLVGSLLAFALLVIADLQRTNRILLEDGLERIKRMQYDR